MITLAVGADGVVGALIVVVGRGSWLGGPAGSPDAIGEIHFQLIQYNNTYTIIYLLKYNHDFISSLYLDNAILKTVFLFQFPYIYKIFIEILYHSTSTSNIVRKEMIENSAL